MCGYSLIRFSTVVIRHDYNLMQIIGWYMEKMTYIWTIILISK